MPSGLVSSGVPEIIIQPRTLSGKTQLGGLQAYSKPSGKPKMASELFKAKLFKSKFSGEIFGPLFKEINVVGNRVEVSFQHSEGLNYQGKKLTHFELAGENETFYVAKARIKNDKVILSCKEVKQPVKVRFAWSNTALPNLFNGAGLPASSFISN